MVHLAFDMCEGPGVVNQCNRDVLAFSTSLQQSVLKGPYVEDEDMSIRGEECYWCGLGFLLLCEPGSADMRDCGLQLQENLGKGGSGV